MKSISSNKADEQKSLFTTLNKNVTVTTSCLLLRVGISIGASLFLHGVRAKTEFGLKPRKEVILSTLKKLNMASQSNILEPV